MNRTLAIIGSHPRTREAFDFTRLDVDVWLFNEAISNKANTWAKRADAVFQMHVPAIWKNPNNRNDPGHYKWLKTQTDCIVYMQDAYPEVPASRRYPLEDIQQMLGGDPNHFLTSSVPQALALAAYLDCYDRVEVYGVAMETNTEYQFQREGVAFWLGFLKGRGIDLHFTDPTFLAPLYGYEGEVFIKYERFGERLDELNVKIEPLQGAYRAAKTAFDLAFDRYAQDGDITAEKELNQGIVNLRAAGEQLGVLDGALQENRRYQAKADEMRVASGGEFVFSRQEFESSGKTSSDRVNELTLELNSIGTTLEHIHTNIRNAAKRSPKHMKYLAMYRQVINQYWQINNLIGIMKGVAGENFNYMAYLDKHIRAAGGSKSEAVILEAMQNAPMV